jgi:hypothetical protein
VSVLSTEEAGATFTQAFLLFIYQLLNFGTINLHSVLVANSIQSSFVLAILTLSTKSSIPPGFFGRYIALDFSITDFCSSNFLVAEFPFYYALPFIESLRSLISVIDTSDKPS